MMTSTVTASLPLKNGIHSVAVLEWHVILTRTFPGNSDYKTQLAGLPALPPFYASRPSLKWALLHVPLALPGSSSRFARACFESAPSLRLSRSPRRLRPWPGAAALVTAGPPPTQFRDQSGPGRVGVGDAVMGGVLMGPLATPSIPPSRHSGS